MILVDWPDAKPFGFSKKTIKFTSCLTRGSICDSDKIEPEKYVVFIYLLFGWAALMRLQPSIDKALSAVLSV